MRDLRQRHDRSVRKNLDEPGLQGCAAWASLDPSTLYPRRRTDLVFERSVVVGRSRRRVDEKREQTCQDRTCWHEAHPADNFGAVRPMMKGQEEG